MKVLITDLVGTNTHSMSEARRCIVMGAVFVNDIRMPDFGEIEVNVGDIVRISKTREFVVTEKLLEKIGKIKLTDEEWKKIHKENSRKPKGLR